MNGKLFVMVGIPGSGKSTFAKRVAEVINGVVISSDDIREEMFGDASIQGDPKVIFAEVEKRVKENLAKGKHVFLDSTSVKVKNRRESVEKYKDYSSELICVVIDTPFEESVKRNASRERVVPEFVLERMRDQYTVPSRQEGWSRVVHIKDTMVDVQFFLKGVGM